MAERLLRTLTFPNLGTYQIQDYNILPRKSLPSAPIHAFADGADNIPVKSMEVAVRAVQDLHGQSSPYPAGGGKNKLNVTGVSSTTVSDVTFTVNADGTIKANGTASAGIVFQIFASGSAYLPLTSLGLQYDTNYILTGTPSSGGANTYRLGLRSGGAAANIVDTGSGVAFNISSTGDTLNWMPCIFVSSGVTLNNVLFSPMIRLATESDATFAPYSNICPISGWDEAKITMDGANLLNSSAFRSSFAAATVQFTQVEGGHYKANGTASSATWIQITGSNETPCVLPVGDYVISTGNNKVVAYAYRTDGTEISHAFGSLTVHNEEIKFVRFLIAQGTAFSNEDVYFQVNYGSSVLPFEAFKGQTVTIDFNGTVYGGLLRYVGGKEWEFTPTHAVVSYNGSETWGMETAGWNDGGMNVFYTDPFSDANAAKMPDYYFVNNAIASWGTVVSEYELRHTEYENRFGFTASGKYCEFTSSLADATAFKTWLTSNPVTVVYELATPLAPITLTADKETVTQYGDNVMFADCGDSSLTYRQDIGLLLAE